MTAELLVFGSSGQVARELHRQAPEAVYLSRNEADLRDPQACAGAIYARRPRAVINAAAWTAVDAAETEEAAATIVHSVAPGAMAQACAALEIPFVHISTDYVFDGSGTAPWHPDDPTGPLGAYGRSKLAGEKAVRIAGGVHIILRTSWVVSAHGSNFVRTMLRLGPNRVQLPVVADQVGGPTPAADIATACLEIVDALIMAPDLSGTHHFAGAPDVSWADFAREIFNQAGLTTRVQDITISDFPTSATRPRNSRMDCTALAADFGINRPDWRMGLSAILDDIKGDTA